jgi:hypothetical protein
MAINRLDFGTTPDPEDGDWALNQAILSKAFHNIYEPLQVDSSNNIPQGATFQVGGVIYYANSDTAITGTPSNYVKLTPNAGDSGATLDAAFVADLTGVSWNKIYNGYYDVSGNLYIFDEIAAIIATEIAGSKTKFSELFNDHLGQNLKPTDNVTFNNLTVNGSAGVLAATSINTDNADLRMKVISTALTGVTTYGINHGLTWANIRGVAIASYETPTPTNIDLWRVTSTQVVVTHVGATGSSGTLYAVVFYV